MSDCPGCKGPKPDSEIYCHRCKAVVEGRPPPTEKKISDIMSDLFRFCDDKKQGKGD